MCHCLGAHRDAVVLVGAQAVYLHTGDADLVIGIGPDREVVGLEVDYQRVEPPNGDGFVNWLTTHLAGALGHAAVMRTRARIVAWRGKEICRLDVARFPRPVWAKTSKDERVFYVRMNNSTRAMPEHEMGLYMTDRWPERPGPLR